MGLRELLPFGKKIEVDLADNPYQTIQRTVLEFLGERDVTITIPKDWSWEWMLPKNETGFVGTLPKRMSKLYYQQHGKRLTLSVQSDLGEMVKRLKPDTSLVTLDIDEKLDWSAGDFGDDSGCFFSYNRHKLEPLKKHGGFAVRHWRDGHGVGRCLGGVFHEALAIFNDKGDERHGLKLLDYARALSRLLKTDYAPASIINNGGYSSGFYLDGYANYLIGPAELLKEIKANKDYRNKRDYYADRYIELGYV